MSWLDYFAKGFGGNKDGSTYMDTGRNEFGFPIGWQPGDNGYAPCITTTSQANKWTMVTYTPRPNFYFCSRPGKRWKK